MYGEHLKNYLQNGKSPGNWEIGGLIEQSSSESLNKVTEIMKEQGITMSLPSTPHFSLSTPQKAIRKDLTIIFYLINVDDQYLDKNFQFMHALFAGTQWLQMTAGLIVGSNVYHVEVPGRFQIQWASATSEFTCEGKLRTNQYMYTKYVGANTNPAESNIPRINSITEDTLWPDAWKVTITITPLSMHNFNTYMDYFANGFGSSQRTKLSNTKGSLISGRAPFTQPDKPKIEATDVTGVITNDDTSKWQKIYLASQDNSYFNTTYIDKATLEKMRKDIQDKMSKVKQSIQNKYTEAFQKFQTEMKVLGNDPLSKEYQSAISAYKKQIQQKKRNQLTNLEKSGNYSKANQMLKNIDSQLKKVQFQSISKGDATTYFKNKSLLSDAQYDEMMKGGGDKK